MHLLIPFAFSDQADCRAALAELKLPQLALLLQRLAPAAADDGSAQDWSPPHERALARALALTSADGAIPWAAWHAATLHIEPNGAPLQQAWAFISPACWTVASHHIAMADPASLGLDTRQADLLLQAMRPFFEEDGIELLADTPTRWLARGEVFRGLSSASLDRVIGHDIEAWMPPAGAATGLRRLQSEMQMLLYTHALSDERQALGLPPVNSFWVSGSGALPGDWRPSGTEPPLMPRRLAQAALQGDWSAWARAWAATDATECAQLLRQLDQGGPVMLTLCGDRNAHSWHSAPQGWLQRLGNRFAARPVAQHLQAL